MRAATQTHCHGLGWLLLCSSMHGQVGMLLVGGAVGCCSPGHVGRQDGDVQRVAPLREQPDQVPQLRVHLRSGEGTPMQSGEEGRKAKLRRE